MIVLETPRLTLRRATLDDAPLVLELVNDPAWLRNIGDKGVRDLDGAREYLRNGPLDMYARLGFGLWVAVVTASGSPIGLCGLIRREALDDPDVGFALLPAFRGKGYATEAASAAIRHGRSALGLPRIVAITSADNTESIRVLEKIGLRFERMIRLPGESRDVKLFGPSDLGDLVGDLGSGL